MTMPRPYLAILDVGHGNSAVIADSEVVVIIDTGTGDSLRQYLNQEGIRSIDLLVLSHADQDHVGGLAQLLASREFRIDRVRVNTDSLQGSVIWGDLLYELNKAHNAGEIEFHVSLVRGEIEIPSLRGVQVQVLGPSRYLAGRGPGSTDKLERRITTNSISAVIRITKGDQPIGLLAGDLDEVGLDDLIDANVDAKAPILVFPHHGGRTGSADDSAFAKRICALVAPNVVVFSIGRGQHGTPRPEIVHALREFSPAVRIACTQLSEHCSQVLPDMDPDHLADAFSRGFERRKCCAGTLIVDLADSGAVTPSEANHNRFIEEFAPTALCKTEVGEEHDV